MTQTVFFGVGATSRLTRVLERLRATRVFLVTGGTSFETSGAAAALAPHLEGRHVYRYSGFSENPKIEDVVKGIQALDADAFDVVVAVGGGSVMDMAKLVNVLAHQELAPAELVAQGRAAHA